MLSQTMLFSFPFVFVRLSVDLLILTYLVMVVMGMKNEENFDGSSSRLGSSTGRDDYDDRNECFWQSKYPSLCMKSMSRLFYKLSFKLFLFP